MPVTLHEGASFLISRESGDIVPGEGRGLFHQDARFLRRLEVTLDGQAPVLLMARVPRETEGMHFLADSRLDGAPMGTVVLVRARCTGDLALVRELWGNVERALEWLQRDGDGFLEYASSTGLANQGWKDSFDSVRFREGTLATQPIALVEVQGYAFDALARCAELALLLGHRGQAEDLRRRALGMRARILSRYWMEEAGFFAEALDGDKRHVDSISSNPGHLLWSGVLPRDKAKRVARVLLSEEMFSGYGVRTMGEAASEDGPLPRRLRAQARRREGGGGGLMSGLPIADFALLSDCRSAALVSRAGSLDGSAGRGSTRRPVSRGSSRIAPATGRSIRRARARRRGAVCTRRWSWKRPSRQPREAPSLPATDERMLATTHAIAERLTDRHGLVYRYRTHAGLPGEEHVPALHLLAGAGAGLAGELDRAKETFSRGGVRQRRGAPFRGSRSGDAAGALPLSTCARTGGDEARAGAETVAWNVSPPWPTRASTTHADARAGQDSVAILASAGLRFRARRACARRRDR